MRRRIGAFPQGQVWAWLAVGVEIAPNLVVPFVVVSNLGVLAGTRRR